jgi:hypothetical protein
MPPTARYEARSVSVKSTAAAFMLVTIPQRRAKRKAASTAKATGQSRREAEDSHAHGRLKPAFRLGGRLSGRRD